MNTITYNRSAAEDHQLVELVEEITARLQAGEPCDIETYAARFPEYADRLPDWMTVMSAMADLGHSLAVGATSGSTELAEVRAAHPASSISQADGSHPATGIGLLGDFRILHEIGRGGMGVVYEAEQISIGRRVALKVLPFAAMLDKQQLNRFKNEARAAGTLDHPNIVAVHAVGVERGVHYYAMQLIEGQSLAQVVEQLRKSNLPRPLGEGRGEGQVGAASGAALSDDTDAPVTSPARLAGPTADTAPIARLSTLPDFSTKEYYRTIAQLGIQAAEALDHAHQNGILHRDIKPANLLVDDSGKLWITDFGLARMEADAGMTMTGDILGTLRYMSPEQALAKRVVVDDRSDIYSLGVTLYELLTLQPAFTGDDRQELLRQIAFEDPANLRNINPHIPTDLETIVFKAIRKDPEHRYATAHSMAVDLRSFLIDQPIKAKPPTWHEQLLRWSRNHPAAIWASLLFLMTTTLISATSAVLITNAYNREAAQREQADTETAKAKAVSDLLQEMLGSADATNAKGADYKVRELLDDFSAGLANQLANEPEAEADIHATIGRAYRSVQRPDQAQPHFEKAIDLRRQNDGPRSVKLADILVDYGWNLRDQQRFSEAESQLKEALDIYRGQNISGAPVFHALEILQHVLISSNRDEDAELVTQQALGIARHQSKVLPDLANLLHRYAGLKIKQGHFAEAEKLARQSVDMHRRLHGDQHPETGWGLRTLASAFVSQQKLADAEAALRESLTIFRRQFPEDHPKIRDTNYQLRTVLEARGDKAALDALAKEEAALAMRSDIAGYHTRLAESLLADTSQSGVTTNVARQLIQRAIDEYGQVAVDWPDDLDRRLKAAQGFVNLVEICVAAPGFSNEIDELNRRLEAELPKIVAAAPEFSDAQFRAAIKYREWGFALSPYSTHLPTVEHTYRESIKLLEKLPLSDPRRPGVWTLMADSYLNLVAVQWRSAKPGDAKASITKVKEIFDQHASVIAADPVYDVASGTAMHFAQLALLLASAHRENDAAEYVRMAAEAARRVQEPADSVNALGVTAIAQLRLGDQSGYRATCKALVDVAIAGTDDLSNGRAIAACCWGPDALADLSLLVKRAEEFAAHNSLEYRHFGPYLLGAALFRDGQYKRAADELKKSIDAYPADPPPEGMKINSKRVGVDTINSQRLFLAMTQWQLGHKDESRQLLAETQTAIDEEFRSPTIFYNSTAVLEVLHREAENLIEPKEADEAVENKSAAATLTTED